MARATDDGRQARSSALFAQVMRHYQAGQFGEANQVCRQVLALDPNHLPGLHLSGLTALQLGLNQAAINVLARAIKLNDKIPDLHSGIAEALRRLGRFEKAIAHYEKALTLDPDYVEVLYNAGIVLLKLKRYDEALVSFDRALAIEPNFAEAINNRGNALFDLKRYDEALADYDRALALRPEFTHALSNRGAALVELKRHEEARASCDRALAIDPADAAALANRGTAFFELRRFVEAAKDFEQLLVIDPDYDYAAGKSLFCRLLYCDWTDYSQAAVSIANKIAAGKRAALPFMFLNILDSASAQMRCAQIFNGDKHPLSAPAIWQGERYNHPKIRIAYLSADFRHHPMAYLMAGLLEAHDKSRFETTAISFGPDPNDEFRKRLENSFDRFLDVQTKNDRDLALLLKRLEIDIAVDLMGYTNNSRPGILAFRPAPIQVNFLGYPGTMGAAYIDYIVADRFIIPEECVLFYTEKIVYLPDTYLPTDSNRPVGEHAPMRSEVGLPEDGFVFCSFNNNYKIVPPIFDVWMRLLLQVEGSVLWLVEDNAAAVRNLRQEAERRGVAPDRLVFAPRVKLEDYLARLRLADLFLDTLPYNAHTTASDALWAGLPVVTCAGSSFAARVAGSLLNAVGLPELITGNLEDYEALALKLARDKNRLTAIRSMLVQDRETFPLFDTDRFRRHIERAYETMWERYQRGESPASFAVARSG
jgi:predicted O-linked N-acetylglucosamine transferase (SPINDLY family)